MTKPIDLHPDRLFPAEPAMRELARSLYATVAHLPIVSPHGHTDPQWFADDTPFANASALFITPDHYVFRMLYSQGLRLEDLGIPRRDGASVASDARGIWRAFAAHYHLFRGTPTRMWLDHAFRTVFGMEERLTAESADRYFDRINAMLATPAFRPRALFERFNIEVIATTESPLDPLVHHRRIRESGWKGRVITAYRPDPVVDPEFEGFADNVAKLGALTGETTSAWNGYLAAHRQRRAFFKSMGATSTDHGHPTALTCDLDAAQCQQTTTSSCRSIRAASAITTPRCSATSAATRAPTSPRAPTTCARCSRCSPGWATSAICRSSCSRSTRPATRASSRRSPATIRY
jgi:glucuronate isomerase